MRSIQILGRDNARVPMQWDDTAFAGFTDRKEGAWMRVHDLYPEINVAKQLGEPDSVLHFWRAMIKLRKEHRDILVHGAFDMYDVDNEATFVFSKRWEGKAAVVALNFSNGEQVVQLSEAGKVQLKISNYEDAEKHEKETASETTRTLRPWEAKLYISSSPH